MPPHRQARRAARHPPDSENSPGDCVLRCLKAESLPLATAVLLIDGVVQHLSEPRADRLGNVQLWPGSNEDALGLLSGVRVSDSTSASIDAVGSGSNPELIPEARQGGRIRVDSGITLSARHRSIGHDKTSTLVASSRGPSLQGGIALPRVGRPLRLGSAPRPPRFLGRSGTAPGSSGSRLSTLVASASTPGSAEPHKRLAARRWRERTLASSFEHLPDALPRGLAGQRIGAVV
jgi:hypothetical protein